MMSPIRLLLVSVVTLTSMGRVTHASDRTDPSDKAFLSIAWFEQRALQIAIKEANRNRNQFYYAFADESSSSESNAKQDLSFLAFRLNHDGVTISANGGRLRYTWDTPSLADDHTLKTRIAANGCSMTIAFSRLKKTGNLWAFQPAKPESTLQSVSSDKGNGYNGRPLHLLFESSSADDCPIVGGPVYLLPNALISDFGHSFDHLIEHVGGSEMVDTFTIGNTGCRYVMAISHEIHTTQGTTQQRVLDLSFGEYK